MEEGVEKGLSQFTSIVSIMNSVGVFREGEINGKQFLLFTLLSQNDSPSSSSSFSGETAIDLSFQPLFLCPSFRIKVLKLKAEENNQDLSFLPVNVLPHFPHQQSEYILDSDCCKLPLLPVFWCNNKSPSFLDFNCGACQSTELCTSYYFCGTCLNMFHKECVETPLIIKHPSQPFRSLQLRFVPNILMEMCHFCKTQIITGMGYHWPKTKLTTHPACAMKPINIFIDHPKRHSHPLTFFPKQAFLPCNVCGLIKDLIPTYVCLRCVFVVHQNCIYFPNVIRISRHHHRISFISSIPSGKWTCGVCRQKVDNNYGAYSCNKCGDYFVHSRCALRTDLWDGKELEGVPEELEVVVEPFKRIADGIILHFSHGHHLKLEISRVYNEDKFCQACVLPIYDGNYYLCMDECGFILHETCAYASFKKYHPLHALSLTLNIDNNFCCYACQRECCGFSYKDPTGNFILDLRCASISEPFEYEGHEHPLFLSLTPEEVRLAICKICQEESTRYDYCSKLNCIECDYIICFKCATLPYNARYKHDQHFLTFYEAKTANDHSEWCDVCEKKIANSTKRGFYSCDKCCTTLHIDCLLGENLLMKPGYTGLNGRHILLNNTMSRPFCVSCEHRCEDKIVFKYNNYAFCSLSCL